MSLSGKIRVALLSFILGTSIMSVSQNIEQLGIKKGIDLRGTLSVNTVSYWSKGLNARREPFNWFLTGNFAFSIFGYDAPFSFSYSNAGKNFSQPFNQISFTPQYKWVKLYIGNSSMTFSDYTLAGHVFLGGGVELSPGKWRIAAMTGRLRKAVPITSNDSTDYSEPSFKRMGYGLKIGFEDTGGSVTANIFKARDVVNSIPFFIPDDGLTPKENLAASFSFRKNFGKFFIANEYAISSLNNNTLAEVVIDTLKPSSNLFNRLLPQNSTNRYFDALRSSLGYQFNWCSLQVSYERVAPEYQTLGAYYFNNDLENIALSPSFRFLKSKLNISGNVGLQRNNLDKSRASTTKRIATSANASFTDQKWSSALTYSDFKSFTNLRPQEDPYFQNSLDTLNFYQVNQTTSLMVMRNFGNAQSPQSIMVNTSWQEANDHADYEGGEQASSFLSMNTSYTSSWVASSSSLTIGCNIFSSDASGIQTQYYGPSLALTKSFFEKKLRSVWSAAYNETRSPGVETGSVWNGRFMLAFSPKSKGSAHHNLSGSMSYLNKMKAGGQSAVQELTATFNYSYSF